MLPSIFGENLFDDFFGTPFDEEFFRGNPHYGKKENRVMKTDIRESDNGYELDIDLPGFQKEDIKISSDNPKHSPYKRKTSECCIIGRVAGVIKRL